MSYCFITCRVCDYTADYTMFCPDHLSPSEYLCPSCNTLFTKTIDKVVQSPQPELVMTPMESDPVLEKYKDHIEAYKLRKREEAKAKYSRKLRREMNKLRREYET